MKNPFVILGLALLLLYSAVTLLDGASYLPIVNNGNVSVTASPTSVATINPAPTTKITPAITATPAIVATPSSTPAIPSPTASPSPTATIVASGHNVLLIIADDLGVEQLEKYDAASDYPATPNIDALFAQGVFFRNAWAAPICSPTRATIFTGRYGFRTGVGNVIGGNTSGPSLALSEFTLPEAIKSAQAIGYATANIGKWHLTALSEGRTMPNQMGCDHYSGVLTGALPDYSAWTKTVNGVNQPATNYATSENVDDAIAWLNTQNATAKPWFLWLAFNAPHSPFHKPPNHLHSFDDLPGTEADINANPYPYYKAAIEAMDSEIGRLLSTLPTAVRANTTILLIGDNGTPTEIIQPPYIPAHAKGTLYQQGIQVPLVIAGAKVVNPGRESSALVNSADLYATIVELMGLTLVTTLPTGLVVDSVSMLPYVQNTSTESIRDWIFSERFAPNSPPLDGKTIRDTRFKLIRFDSGQEEFYDLAVDAFEQTNLPAAGLTGEAQASYCALSQAMNDLLLSEPGITVPTLPGFCLAN